MAGYNSVPKVSDDAPQGDDQLSANRRFRDECPRAGIERGRANLRGVVLGDDYDLRHLSFFAYQPRRFQAIQAWHANVEYNNIGFEGFALLDGVHAINGFSADQPLRGWFQQSAKPAPEYFVVINDQYPRVRHIGPL